MFKLNQRGQSLPIVLGVTALILANTYYFLSVDKTSTARTQLAGAQVAEQTERSRIASFLADYNVCASEDKAKGNFYNKSISSLSNSVTGIATPLVKPHPISNNLEPFLAVNALYVNNTHRVKKYFLGIDNSIASNELKYFLQVEYDIIVVDPDNTQRINTKAPKISAVVKIPLFIQADGTGKIMNCYARPAEENETAKNSISAAVAASCTLAAPSPSNSSTAFLDNSTTATRCFHTLTPTDCPPGQVMNGTTSNNAQNKQQFTCTGLDSLCNPSPIQQAAIGIIDSTVTCGTPENGGCLAGTFMIKNGSSVTCSQNCPITQLFHSISPAGLPTCYDRTEQCPSGQYAKSINADGKPTCEAIKYRNVDCGALKYATDVDPAYSGTDPLKCSNYTRTKDCPGTFNYVSSFQSTTVSCRNLNY